MTKLTQTQDGVTTGMETESRLIAALSRKGQASLAEHLGISEAEVSRKINGNSGWSLEQLAKALDFNGARVLPGDGSLTIVDRDELIALRTLAQKGCKAE